MRHKQICIGYVLAYIGWAIAFGLVVVGWIVDDAHMGQLGILIGAAAAAATVRLWMLDSVDSIENTVSVVREAEQAYAGVRPLR